MFDFFRQIVWGKLASWLLIALLPITGYFYWQTKSLESALSTCQEDRTKLKSVAEICEDQAKQYSDQLKFSEERYEKLKDYYKRLPKPPTVDNENPVDDGLLDGAFGLRQRSPNRKSPDTNTKGAGSK